MTFINRKGKNAVEFLCAAFFKFHISLQYNLSIACAFEIIAFLLQLIPHLNGIVKFTVIYKHIVLIPADKLHRLSAVFGVYYSKSSVKGATYSVTMSDKVKGRRVYCVITDAYGNSVKTKTVLLRESLSIITQPKNTYAQLDKTAKVKIEASGDDLTYEWYIKNAGAKKYSKSSVTKATYSCKMNEKSKDRYVYCVVTDKYGNTEKSKTVVLREAVSIVTQPKTGYAKNGKTVKVSVEASGDGLTYQWFFKNAGSSKYTESSVTSATYSTKMTDKVNGRQVYCVVTDKYGKTVKSDVVTLKMK